MLLRSFLSVLLITEVTNYMPHEAQCLVSRYQRINKVLHHRRQQEKADLAEEWPTVFRGVSCCLRRMFVRLKELGRVQSAQETQARNGDIPEKHRSILMTVKQNKEFYIYQVVKHRICKTAKLEQVKRALAT